MESQLSRVCTQAPVRFLALMTSLLCLFAASAQGAATEEQRHAQRWQQLRTAVFFDREMSDGDGVVAITAPVLAKDPAGVPVTISTHLDGNDGRFVKSITLLVDHNPAPLAAVFHLGPRSGSGAIKTRVRVSEFSNIRAIAETSDGQLHVARTFVKASGGCDVPPLQDEDRIAKTLGDMKLYLPGGARQGQSSMASLMISHPNYNGMQVSNTAGVYLPARFVKEILVRYADEMVMRIEGHLSLSQDPRLQFSYLPDRPGSLSVEVIDSEDTRFEERWSVDLASGLD